MVTPFGHECRNMIYIYLKGVKIEAILKYEVCVICGGMTRTDFKRPEPDTSNFPENGRRRSPCFTLLELCPAAPRLFKKAGQTCCDHLELAEST